MVSDMAFKVALNGVDTFKHQFVNGLMKPLV